MLTWPMKEMVLPLVERGYFVVRFDHRDHGQSQYLSGQSASMIGVGCRSICCCCSNPVPYTLNEMAQDAVDLLSALSIKEAHLVTSHARRCMLLSCVLGGALDGWDDSTVDSD